jgi:predicted CoA-binding protein
MSGEACPMPTPPRSDEIGAISRMLAARRIAIVGLSDDPMRPSHSIAEYLMSRGYEIVGINPNHDEVLGQKCYAKLADVPGEIDVVNVFRRPLACGDVARQAIAIGVKGLWLQSGIMNDEAHRLAADAGIDFIQNRCIMVEHMRRVRG